MADDGLRSRTQNQRLRQFFPASDRDYRQLRRETFNVMFFLLNKALWNEQRERHILVPGGLESRIQRLLNVFPQRPAIRPHNHAAAHRRIIRQLRLQHQLVVPFGKILRTCGKLFFGHAALYGPSTKRFRFTERKSVTDEQDTVNESGVLPIATTMHSYPLVVSLVPSLVYTIASGAFHPAENFYKPLRHFH